MGEMYLRKLYYDVQSPISFTSEKNLWERIKRDHKEKIITRSDLKKWLEEQYTYTLHKPYNKPGLYRKTMVHSIDEQWQADLVDMREFSKQNDQYNYLLTVIDCLSRFVWVVKLKSKTGKEVTEAFRQIFLDTVAKATGDSTNHTGRVPLKLQTDDGLEFYNRNMKELLEKNHINHFSTYSDKKAAIVERFNRTLKSRMYKYFTQNETRRWIDIIQQLVNGYNNAYHSTIKMTPTEASKLENAEIVWWNIYGAYVTADYGVARFKNGQTVRISKYKSVFDKGYLPNFTEEYFKIKQVIIGKPIVYKLEDLKGEALNGIFYENELSAYNPTEKTEYKIETVLGRKTVKGKKYVLVKYKGWPDKFNDWIPATN